MRYFVISCFCGLLALSVCLTGPALAAEEVGAQTGHIEQLVRDWSRAWSSGQFADYAGYYIDAFTGSFETNAAWLKHRRDRVAGRRDISIDIGAVLVLFDADDPGKAEARFVQSYRSSTYCDVVEKTLGIQRTGSGWRISAEKAATRSRC